MSTTETSPSQAGGIPSVIFTAILSTVGAVVGLLAIVMIVIFFVLCVRELFRRHAKGRETDRVGLLNDDQVAINSDQEEEFTTSIDQDVTTVRVERGEAGKKKSPVLSGLSGSGNKVSPIHGQTVAGEDDSPSYRRRKLVQEDSVEGEDLTCTRIDDLEESIGHDGIGPTRKVRAVSQAELQIRAKKLNRSLSFMKRISKSNVLSRAAMSLVKFNDSYDNPVVVMYKDVPTNAIDQLNLQPEEKPKNRYRNVLPNPHSRVFLSDTGAPGSTYINANYIRDLYGEENAYIATQGPTFDTMADFWRMVWEKEVTIVVMLTNLIERGRHKCAKYWPAGDTDPVVHGFIQVSNAAEQKNLPSYTLATLRVKNLRTGEVRTVYHFWCVAWPDFGIPEETDAILKLQSAVSELSTPSSGPVVVHCSAGLGRSGTFISIDMGVQQYKSEGVVDPLKYLCEMRQDRGGMIQTSDQFLFVHMTLADYMNM